MNDDNSNISFINEYLDEITRIYILPPTISQEEVQNRLEYVREIVNTIVGQDQEILPIPEDPVLYVTSHLFTLFSYYWNIFVFYYPTLKIIFNIILIWIHGIIIYECAVLFVSYYFSVYYVNIAKESVAFLTKIAMLLYSIFEFRISHKSICNFFLCLIVFLLLSSIIWGILIYGEVVLTN